MRPTRVRLALALLVTSVLACGRDLTILDDSDGGNDPRRESADGGGANGGEGGTSSSGEQGEQGGGGISDAEAPPQVTCNGVPCQAGEKCCFAADQNVTCRACSPGGLSLDFQLDCQGPEQCDGRRCCLKPNGVATCASTCGFGEIALCDGQTMKGCEGGGTCKRVRCAGKPSPLYACKTSDDYNYRQCEF